MKIKEKRGDLKEHIGDIIIGILCLALIIAAIVIIYKVFVNQEAQNAKVTIDGIEAKINNLAVGQNGTFSVSGFPGAAPSDITAARWYFIGWSKAETGRPGACTYESCLCICKGSLGADKSALVAECDKEGFCRAFPVSSIQVQTNFKATEFAGKNVPYIRLESNLLDINVVKKKDNIEVYHDDYFSIL